MKIFNRGIKARTKAILNDLLLEGKAIVDTVIEMFDDIKRLNCISHVIGKTIDRDVNVAMHELAEIQKKQAKSTFFKMLKAYANLNILKLPANWQSTQQYKIFRRGDLVQYKGYLSSILKDLQTEGDYITKTGRKKHMSIILNKDFLLKEIEKCNVEISLIDEQMSQYNSCTAIAFAY